METREMSNDSVGFSSKVIECITKGRVVMKSIPGCGNGLIATTDIPAGSVVLAEPGIGYFSPETCCYHECRRRLTKNADESVNPAKYFICPTCNCPFCDNDCYQKSISSGVHSLECPILYRIYNGIFFCEDRGFAYETMQPLQRIIIQRKYAAYANGVNLIVKLILLSEPYFPATDELRNSELEELKLIWDNSVNGRSALYPKETEIAIEKWFNRNAARLLLSTSTFGFSELACEEGEVAKEAVSRLAEQNADASRMLEIDQETFSTREAVCSVVLDELLRRPELKSRAEQVASFFVINKTGFIDDQREEKILNGTTILLQFVRDIFNRCLMSQYGVEVIDYTKAITAKKIVDKIRENHSKYYDHSLCQSIYTMSGMAMFSLVSRINNNCTPNSVVRFPNYSRARAPGCDENETTLFQKADTGFSTVIAIRDIKKGEQICTNYLTLTEQPWSKRFEQPWRFKCMCDRCRVDNAITAELDAETPKKISIDGMDEPFVEKILKEELAKTYVLECPLCNKGCLKLSSSPQVKQSQARTKYMRPTIVYCSNCGPMTTQSLILSKKFTQYNPQDKNDLISEIYTVFERHGVVENLIQYIDFQRCAEMLLTPASFEIVKKMKIFNESTIPQNVASVFKHFKVNFPAEKQQTTAAQQHQKKKKTKTDNQYTNKVDVGLFHLHPESVDCAKALLIMIFELTVALESAFNDLKPKQRIPFRRYILFFSEMAVTAIIRIMGGDISDEKTYAYGGEISGGTLMWLYHNAQKLIIDTVMSESDDDENVNIYVKYNFPDTSYIAKVAKTVARILEGEKSLTVREYEKVEEMLL